MSPQPDKQEPIKILVVEDDPTTREAMTTYLEVRGFDVRSADSAAAALDIAEDFEPHILLSDWDLGGKRTGVDVARELQADLDTRVIFISGNPLHQLREASRDVDVLRYLRKPISLDRLTRLIDRCMPVDRLALSDS